MEQSATPGAGFLTGFGYLMMANGAGALVTLLALAGVSGDRTRGRAFLWLGVLSGLTPVALALSPNLSLVMLSAAALGAAGGGFMAISQGMLQSIAPDAIRGRVMSVYSWHTQEMMAVFNLVNGTLAAVTMLTVPLILGASGLGFVMVMAASFGRVPLRHLYGGGVPAEARST